MPVTQVVPIFGLNSVAALRQELSERAQRHAELIAAPYLLTQGKSPAVCFEPYAERKKHGNFLDSSYRAILRTPAWAKRLTKVHTHSGRSIRVSERSLTHATARTPC
jgi:hypothetical protein